MGKESQGGESSELKRGLETGYTGTSTNGEKDNSEEHTTYVPTE